VVIDGVLPQRRLRYVMVRGEAGALRRWLGAGGGGLGSVIRVGPRQVIGTSLDGATSGHGSGARQNLEPSGGGNGIQRDRNT